MWEPLLAADAEKKFSKGWLLHKVGKQFIRFAVNFLAEHILASVIRYKKETGWLNPEIQIFYEDISRIIEIEEARWTWGGKKPKGEYNADRRLWTNIRDVLCILLDEDSFYFLRFIYLLSFTFEHAELYDKAMSFSRIYWDRDKFRRWFCEQQQLEALHKEKLKEETL